MRGRKSLYLRFEGLHHPQRCSNVALQLKLALTTHYRKTSRLPNKDALAYKSTCNVRCNYKARINPLLLPGITYFKDNQLMSLNRPTDLSVTLERPYESTGPKNEK